MRRALIAVILVTLAAGAVAGARQKPEFMAWLRVPHGDAGIGSGIDGPPYTPGQRVRVYLVNPTPEAKTEDGLVVSGFSIHGWKEGDAIRVVVLAALPPEGKENRFYPFSTGPEMMNTMRFREFARYAMAAGETRSVSEMKALGVEPMILQVMRTP
jgi:hypothetical protein